MSYIGIHPQLRAYHSSVYVANEGETKLPLRKDVEAVLIKNGVILIPDTDYYPDAKNDLVLTAPAKAGDEFFLLNLSTFTFSDTVSRSELEKELELRQDPMFSVIWLPSRNVIPAGYVPADGQLEQRSMYPSAWEAIEKAVVPVVEDSEWSTGNRRASYSRGDGSNTFRVPDYNGKTDGAKSLVLRGDGGNADVVGVIQDDAIRNITGDVNPNFLASSFADQDTLYGTGALRGRVGQKSNKYSYSLNGPYHGGALDFDASRVVPTAEENRMVNTAGVWCIRLGHRVVNSGIITGQGVVDKVNQNSMIINNLIEKNKWYTADTPQFKSRFEAINGWLIGGYECLFKETDREIRFKGIIRRTTPSTDVNILRIKNTKDTLLNSYQTFLCNNFISDANKAFSSYYFEPIKAINTDAYLICNTLGITNWIMVEMTIAKNPIGNL